MLNLSNRVTLIGRASSTPEFSQQENGNALLRFTLTTTTTWTGDDQVRSRTEHHPIEIHNVFARRLHPTLVVGHEVLCEGALRARVTDGVRTAVVVSDLANDLGVPSSGARASRNTVILHGNVGGTPELKDAGGTPLLTVRLATPAHGEEPEWHTVKVWGSRATALEAILRSGYKVSIAGELRHEHYSDAQGREQHVAAVHAHEIQLVHRPG